MGTTTTDDAFHEIQLNGKQLVFLFMSAVVILVVVFLFGVLVGRGVRDDRGPVEASTQPDAPPVTAAVPDAAPPAVPPTGAPTAANEDLSYPKRLSNDKPEPERLRTAKEASAPAVPAAREITDKPQSAPAQSSAPASAGFAEPAGAGFAIQVAALRQRSEADSVARSLSTKGYPAYVLNPETGAPAVFRVRVGKFKDRSEAETIAARLQKEEQFKPWIVR